MVHLWKHIFDELNLDPKNVNVLLTDSPLNSKENKKKMTQIMFEHFRVESLAIMNTSVLSLFSTGKTTGMVVECGEGVSYTVPVFEGYAMPHAIHKLDIAGQDVTNELIRQLKEDKVPINQDHFEYVRDMKEQMCAVALNYEQALHQRDPLNEEQRSYELPDDKGIIQVGHPKRFRSTEIIFNPRLIGSEVNGLANIAFTAIEKCDNDLKINLYNNIVLSGGTTLLPGFHERFDYEIRKEAREGPKEIRDKAWVPVKTDINVFADLHRKYAAWIGGSMIASFSTFQDMTIKREEYDGMDSDKDTLVLKKTVY